MYAFKYVIRHFLPFTTVLETAFAALLAAPLVSVVLQIIRYASKMAVVLLDIQNLVASTVVCKIVIAVERTAARTRNPVVGKTSAARTTIPAVKMEKKMNAVTSIPWHAVERGMDVFNLASLSLMLSGASH